MRGSLMSNGKGKSNRRRPLTVIALSMIILLVGVLTALVSPIVSADEATHGSVTPQADFQAPASDSSVTMATDAKYYLLRQQMSAAVVKEVSRQRSILSELRTRLEKTRTQSESLQIQRQIEDLKLNLEVRVMEVQRETALKAGALEVVKQLDSTIAQTKKLSREDQQIPAASNNPSESSR